MTDFLTEPEAANCIRGFNVAFREHLDRKESTEKIVNALNRISSMLCMVTFVLSTIALAFIIFLIDASDRKLATKQREPLPATGPLVGAGNVPPPLGAIPRNPPPQDDAPIPAPDNRPPVAAPNEAITTTPPPRLPDGGKDNVKPAAPPPIKGATPPGIPPKG